MTARFLQHMAINDDVDAEFLYWKNQFLFSAYAATGSAVTVGIMIALWPEGTGNAEVREFVRNLWTLFAECAFWFGFLAGLLWAAAKRIGSGLARTLPWQPARQLSPRATTARFFGQWAASFALAGIFLWITAQFGSAVDASVAGMFAALTPFIDACFGSAAIFATITLIRREPSPRHRLASRRPHN